MFHEFFMNSFYDMIVYSLRVHLILAHISNERGIHIKNMTRLRSSVEMIHSEILEARTETQKQSIYLKYRWQPKLPRTLADVSLPLTVIGGYSDSNGIPTSTSDRPPSFYIRTYTVTPEMASLYLHLCSSSSIYRLTRSRNSSQAKEIFPN